MAGASPSQQQQLTQIQTSVPSSSLPSSSISGPSSVQPAPGNSGSVAGSDQQGQGQGQAGGGGPAASSSASGGAAATSGGTSGGNPPTPHPAREMVSQASFLSLSLSLSCAESAFILVCVCARADVSHGTIYDSKLAGPCIQLCSYLGIVGYELMM